MLGQGGRRVRHDRLSACEALDALGHARETAHKAARHTATDAELFSLVCELEVLYADLPYLMGLAA